MMMGKFYRYRYLVLKDQDGYKRFDKNAQSAYKKESRGIRSLVIAVFVTLLVLFTFYNSDIPIIQRIANKLGFRNEVYAVIIDAGSTGSRVLAYTFYKSDDDILIQDELFHEVKPGLSSYVDRPEKGAESILKLISVAYEKIPARHRSSSPLIVRATAGLRMLDVEAANKLLESVREAIKTTGFLVQSDSVDIMDGEPEGIYSWFTVNYLQDRLRTQTAAALDLGGGSTQVTYEPRSADPPKPLIVIPDNGKNTTLYTHSYSGLGLMALRYGVLMDENNNDATQMESRCINPTVKGVSWRYSNKNYLVSGSQKNMASKDTQVVNIESCKSIVYKIVRKYLKGVPVPTGIADQHVNVFSYFTDRAADAGLIDDLTAGGMLKVSDYIKASEKECARVNTENPWLCLDLTYIAVLLQEAYKLPVDKEVQLLKKIKGHEVSWAMGLAYNTLIQNI